MSETTIESQVKTGLLRRPVVFLAGLLILQLGLYFSTYQSMVEIWWRSETFAHGFFILPISAYLIWKKRQQLATTACTPDFRILLPMACIGLLWMLAYTVDVLVVEQFAVVLMLPLLVWLVQGGKLAAVIAFPLAFLLFAVPFGDFLVYPLMEFTAVFTVNAVRMVGIPVFWEGMYFSLPTGSWSVVEACSGFRYILASLTLGALYAYLSYHSFMRRAAFMLLALVVPIIANGIRAFMIVMIGHFSGMELAVGVDHLIYGWVWFGVVMFLMFWIGSFWQDKAPKQETVQAVANQLKTGMSFKRSGIAVLLAAIFLILPVLLVKQMNTTAGEVKVVNLPFIQGDWKQTNSELTSWEPDYQGASQELSRTYLRQDDKVAVYIAYFGSQQQDAELANSKHQLISDEQKSLGWKEISRESRTVLVEGREVALRELQIKSPQESLLVWQWKYFHGTHTDNDFYLKGLEAWAKLTGQPRDGAAIVLTVERDDLSREGLQQAATKLQMMAESLLPALETELD